MPPGAGDPGRGLPGAGTAGLRRHGLSGGGRARGAATAAAQPRSCGDAGAGRRGGRAGGDDRRAAAGRRWPAPGCPGGSGGLLPRRLGAARGGAVAATRRRALREPGRRPGRLPRRRRHPGPRGAIPPAGHGPCRTEPEPWLPMSDSMELTRTLRLAQPMLRGEDVLWLQTRLQAGGWPGAEASMVRAADGLFGPRTAEAVEALQRGCGLA
ncbi:MAG: peptidoglycan-binding protein, partial [Acetobacteraceae bacterium]